MKPTNESGGYGILMGPQASQDDIRDKCAESIRKDPRNYIAQPMYRQPRYLLTELGSTTMSTCDLSFCLVKTFRLLVERRCVAEGRFNDRQFVAGRWQQQTWVLLRDNTVRSVARLLLSQLSERQP